MKPYILAARSVKRWQRGAGTCNINFKFSPEFFLLRSICNSTSDAIWDVLTADKIFRRCIARWCSRRGLWIGIRAKTQWCRVRSLISVFYSIKIENHLNSSLIISRNVQVAGIFSEPRKYSTAGMIETTFCPPQLKPVTDFGSVLVALEKCFWLGRVVYCARIIPGWTEFLSLHPERRPNHRTNTLIQ